MSRADDPIRADDWESADDWERPDDPVGIFSRTRTVREAEIDGLGHVNNAVWVSLVVSIAEAHSKAMGFDWETVRGLGGMWIVRRHEIDYHRSAMLGQRIVSETWVEAFKGARSFRRTRVTLADDGALLLSGLTQWAFVDPETQRPKRIPRQLIETFRLVSPATAGLS